MVSCKAFLEEKKDWQVATQKLVDMQVSWWQYLCMTGSFIGCCALICLIIIFQIFSQWQRSE